MIYHKEDESPSTPRVTANFGCYVQTNIPSPTNCLRIIWGKGSKISLKQIRSGQRSRVAATASQFGNTRVNDPTTRQTDLSFFLRPVLFPGLRKENAHKQQADEDVNHAVLPSENVSEFLSTSKNLRQGKVPVIMKIGK